MSLKIVIVLLYIVSLSLSFQLKGNDMNYRYSSSSLSSLSSSSSSSLLSLSIQLKNDQILELLEKTDRGIKATQEEVVSIDNWIRFKESQYDQNALDDTKLFGYYDVSYVGAGSNQTGNPAGGGYRGKLGQIFYKNEGLYQHVLKSTVKGKEISVINVVKGRLLHFFVLYVILDGWAIKLNASEKQRLSNKYGNNLSEGTVKAFFLAPLLGIGLYNKADRLFSFRIGPKSDVVLDTTFLDDTFRLGRGSRGSTFVFQRLSELDQNIYCYKDVLSKKVVNGKKVGAVLALAGISVLKLVTLNLAQSRFNFYRILTLFLKLTFFPFGLITLFSGIFLLFSKGGIVDENFSN